LIRVSIWGISDSESESQGLMLLGPGLNLAPRNAREAEVPAAHEQQPCMLPSVADTGSPRPGPGPLAASSLPIHWQRACIKLASSLDAARPAAANRSLGTGCQQTGQILNDAHWHSELWVLRSTFTLKTTDTTLVSVDGGNGQRGALIQL
jgi:hypothetical protein